MMRLQAYISSQGLMSRRKCESLIKEGVFFVNGKKAILGTQVKHGDVINFLRTKILVDLQINKQSRLILYNKPIGEICSYSDPLGRKTVFDNLPSLQQGKWINVGRLDINSSGLLLFTNNGQLAYKLMHPKYNIEREYLVRIHGKLSETQKQQILVGIKYEEVFYKVDALEEHRTLTTNTWYRIMLSEGKNREIRQIMRALGFSVTRLIRTRYGDFQLPQSLKPGMWCVCKEIFNHK